MNMNWLLAPHNTLFAGAFILVLCFSLLELISMVMGLGLSDFLSDLLGLPDGPDGDVSHSSDTDGHGSGWLTPVLSWLEIGKVPVLVSLCAFLAAFGISGMMLQEALILAGFGPLLESLAAVAAFLVALPVLKFSNRLMGRVFPQDETSAFAPDLLVGRIGIVTIGAATSTRAAEVRVLGPDGKSHYVMCYAGDESVSQGGELLLKSRDAATGHFRGEQNQNPDLSPAHYQ